MPKTKAVKTLKTVINNAASRTSTRKTNSLACQIVSSLQKHYKDSSSPTHAASMKKYMRMKFDYYGVYSQERRAIDKQVFSEYPRLKLADLKELLTLLWQCDQRELQYCAIDVAQKQRNLFCTGENQARLCMESARFIGEFITTKSWWDTVDRLACSVIGHFVLTCPELVSLMDTWLTSEDMWLRRTAILHQLSYAHDTDQERLFKYCSTCLHEREFFIEKSIGWSLRQYFKYNPEAVKKYVSENEDKMAKLSKREALKHA